MKRIVTGGALAIAVIAFAGAVYATDHPLAALKLILKQNTATAQEKAVLVVKPFALGLPAASPISVGATYSVTGLNQTGTTPLPASGWKTNPGGTLYKFINKDAPSGPSLCKVALVKANTVFKVVCKDSMIDLDDATQGTVKARLAIGDDVYCVECAAPLKDEPGKYIAGLYGAGGSAYGSASLAFLGTSADLLD
jgi:hypothetical protein